MQSVARSRLAEEEEDKGMLVEGWRWWEEAVLGIQFELAFVMDDGQSIEPDHQSQDRDRWRPLSSSLSLGLEKSRGWIRLC